jgi:serine/threonine protein phosphatase PrpC
VSIITVQTTKTENTSVPLVAKEVIEIYGLDSLAIEQCIKASISKDPTVILTLTNQGQPRLKIRALEISPNGALGRCYALKAIDDTQTSSAAPEYMVGKDKRGTWQKLYEIGFACSASKIRFDDREFLLPYLGEIDRALIDASKPISVHPTIVSDIGFMRPIEFATPYGPCILSMSAGLDIRMNDDAALFRLLADEGLFLAVADGMGGRPGGLFAARSIIETLATRKTHENSFEDVIYQCGNVLLQQYRELGQHLDKNVSDSMATTLAALQIYSDHALAMRVGDCRIVVFRKASSGYHLDWSTEDQGYGNLVFNMVGIKHGSVIKTDVQADRINLRSGDIVIAADDGLWKNSETSELEQILSTRKSLCDQENAIMEAVQDRVARNNFRGDDNISIIIHHHQ